MRKHLIWAVIGGLVLPITLICVAADVAAIRNISMLHNVAVKGASIHRLAGLCTAEGERCAKEHRDERGSALHKMLRNYPRAKAPFAVE